LGIGHLSAGIGEFLRRLLGLSLRLGDLRASA
jgi:hypothetical protein